MDVRFYTTPFQTWDAMLEDCRAATRSIEMEQYILADDAIGHAFLDLFLEKLRSGVAVRLLLDRIGSRDVHGSVRIKNIVEAGGQVRFYNPPNMSDFFTPTRWFPRNHTKTLLIDSEIAYIGGVCLEAPMADWRDLQIRFTGPAVAPIEARFSLERIKWRTRAKNWVRRDVDAGLPLEYVVHRPHLGPNPIYRRLVRAIRNAKTSVRLVTPYFLPPYGLRRAMRLAARRGVKVQVMMSKETDAIIADCVSHSYFPWMYRNKIGISLFTATMLHAKYAIVDDSWATIGSSNLDYLSLKHNREANVIIRDPAIIRKLHGQFDADLKDCIEADKDYWHNLPLLHRMLGYLGRAMKKIL
jgi:cardiolipin synthase